MNFLDINDYNMNRIYLSPPSINSEEKEKVLGCLASNWISPAGPDITAFEKDVSKYLSINSACALSSGTAALHLALRVLGIGRGDKVICPTLTFAATSNVLLYENADPIFIDVNREDWLIDIALVEKAFEDLKPKALITVDLYGQSCNYKSIVDLCKKYNVYLIEDAAEAFGSEYKREKCASFGDIGILSFNGNKIITTGGGGMFVSNDEKLTDKARFLSSQAREQVIHYEHKELGYNYRLSNLLAAVGIAQMKKLDLFVKRRRKIFDYYYKNLSEIEGVSFMDEAADCKSNRWLTTLTIDETKAGISRDEIIKALEMENIESRPVWKPMHLQPLYKDYDYISKDGQDISAELFHNGLCLPSGSSLSKENQDRILDIIFSLL